MNNFSYASSLNTWRFSLTGSVCMRCTLNIFSDTFSVARGISILATVSVFFMKILWDKSIFVSTCLRLDRTVPCCHVFSRLHFKLAMHLCFQRLWSGTGLTQTCFCTLFNWGLLGRGSRISLWATHIQFFLYLHTLLIISLMIVHQWHLMAFEFFPVSMK